MSAPAALALAAFLILGNGFFVGVEFALLASRRSLLVQQAESSRRARLTLSAVDRLPLMVAACQFGITLCSLGLGAVGEPALSHLIEPLLELVQLPSNVLHPVAFAVALIIVAVLHMVIGEMVPKNVALAGPERTALMLTPALLTFLRVFRPLITGLTWAANAILRRLGVDVVDESASASGHTAEQVAALVAEARREGLLGRRATGRMENALELGQKSAADIVVPTSRVVTVGSEASTAQIEDLVAATGYSRFPVKAEDTPGYLGYLHVTDVIGVSVRGRTKPVAREMSRPLPACSSAAALQDVLQVLQRSGAHLGRVVDEHDATLGVIFLEDVLEELVGEVRDVTRRHPA